jgi:hypothetical protein
MGSLRFLLGQYQSDEGEQATSSLSLRLRWFLGTSLIGLAVDIADIFISAVYCVTYISETYSSEVTPKQHIVATACIGFFGLLFALHLFVATKRMHFIMDWQTALDVLSGLPVLAWAFPGVSDTLGTRLLKLCAVTRASHLHKLSRFVTTDINRQLFR